jgi:hypothetical protein
MAVKTDVVALEARILTVGIQILSGNYWTQLQQFRRFQKSSVADLQRKSPTRMS